MKRGDENKLERLLRLEKVVTSKQLRFTVETEEEKIARLENDAVVGHGDGRRKKSKTGEATTQLTLALEIEEERRGKKRNRLDLDLIWI